jgi:hypothetical protein
MLLAIFGTPSLLTQWVVNFANTLVDVVEGSPVYIPAMSIESLKEQWQNRGEKSVVFHSDTPRKEVIELFQRSGAPIVVVWEPVAVVADFVSTARSLDIQTAVRFTTQSVCTLAELVTQSDVWVIDSEMATVRLSDFIDRFLSYHQIEIDSAKRQGLAQARAAERFGGATHQKI